MFKTSRKKITLSFITLGVMLVLAVFLFFLYNNFNSPAPTSAVNCLPVGCNATWNPNIGVINPSNGNGGYLSGSLPSTDQYYPWPLNIVVNNLVGVGRFLEDFFENPIAAIVVILITLALLFHLRRGLSNG